MAKLLFHGLVKEIKTVDTTKTGERMKRPFTVVSFVDLDTAGDVIVQFPGEDCPYKPLQDLQVELTVKGRMSGYNVVFDVVQQSAQKVKAS